MHCKRRNKVSLPTYNLSETFFTISYPESSISINVQPASGSYDNPGFDMNDERYEQANRNVKGALKDEPKIMVILVFNV